MSVRAVLFLCLSLALSMIAPRAVVAAAAAENKLPDAVRQVLEQAESFELYSLDPEPGEQEGGGGFRGWKVLGHTPVGGADARRDLLAALQSGIQGSDGSDPRCFNPRHGVRATRGGKTVDLVICFECLKLRAYEGDKVTQVLTKDSPQPAFDAILKAAKIPIAPRT